MTVLHAGEVGRLNTKDLLEATDTLLTLRDRDWETVVT